MKLLVAVNPAPLVAVTGFRSRGRGPGTPAVARGVGQRRVRSRITAEDGGEGDLGDPRLGIVVLAETVKLPVWPEPGL